LAVEARVQPLAGRRVVRFVDCYSRRSKGEDDQNDIGRYPPCVGEQAGGNGHSHGKLEEKEMSDPSSIDEILDFAIESEQAAVDLYLRIAAAARNPAIEKVFKDFANEERGHKIKLEKVKTGKQILSLRKKPVMDLKISDYTADEELQPDADYQSVLIFAMKREKAAFKLYTDLAGKTDDSSLRDLLLGLAQEEAKHKLRFEIEYDDHILTDN